MTFQVMGFSERSGVGKRANELQSNPKFVDNEPAKNKERLSVKNAANQKIMASQKQRVC
jgi:hypothetical protein